MRGQDHRPRFIRTRRRAIAALLVTLWFVVAKVSFIARHKTHSSNWIYPLHSFLPTWLAVTGNILTYVFCIYTLIEILRGLKGAERFLFAALFVDLILGLAGHWSPRLFDQALQLMELASDFVMFFAAVHLYLRIEERTTVLLS
jgi:uncharacterized membrane protein